MNTCLTCENSIPEGFGFCLDCETLLWKAQLIVEVFMTLRQRQSAPGPRTASASLALS